MEYLLRIEGVNFADFVYDTAKLPVIRGGSALMLQAPFDLAEHLYQAHGLELERITTGASIGLYSFSADEESIDTAALIRDAEEYFASHVEYRHGSFMVAVLAREPGQSFRQHNELALATNRWKQKQSLSVVVPKAAPAGDAIACQFDGVRPAIEEIRDSEGNTEVVSVSVAARRRKGQNKDSGSGASRPRADFYHGITGIDRPDLPEFPEDFNDLAAPGPGVPPKLAGKMAVIYIDGNKFGSRVRAARESPKALTDWDKRIRGYRQEFLRQLFVEIAPEGRVQSDWGNDNRLRFETLVWGGDDALLVAPAWKGWWLLGRFFELSEKWTDLAGEPLTHCAGLVFCHAKAPIHRVQKLAGELCDLAKKHSRGYESDRRMGNRFAYQVLESFDHVGRDLSKFLKERRPDASEECEHVLFGDSMLGAVEHCRTLEREEMPLRKLHALVPKMIREQGFNEEAKALRELEACDTALKGLEPCMGTGPMQYAHLLELWDYIR